MIPAKVIAQALGIVGGTIFNFTGLKYWIFKSNE